MDRNPLYKKSRWARKLEQVKLELGVHKGYSQDELDQSLFEAVQENNTWAISAMNKMGANPNMFLKPKNGKTICSLLHLAVIKSDLNTIGTLLKIGANPRVLDSNGLVAKDYGILKKRPGRILTMLTKWEQKDMLAVNDDNRQSKIIEINNSPFSMKPFNK